MPTINIPPRVRFVLYLAGAIALLLVAYGSDRHFVGGPEVRLVTGLAALLQVLAAAKTDLTAGGDRPTSVDLQIDGTALASTVGRRARRRRRGPDPI